MKATLGSDQKCAITALKFSISCFHNSNACWDIFGCLAISDYSVSYLLLSGDVIIDEGHPLVGALTSHTGDPGHRHLTGLDGRLCAVAAKFCLLLQSQTGNSHVYL